MLTKIRRFLRSEQRKLYYNTIIKQLMLYGSTVWSNCSSDDMMRFFKLQKRTARVILEADARSSSVKFFRTKISVASFL